MEGLVSTLFFKNLHLFSITRAVAEMGFVEVSMFDCLGTILALRFLGNTAWFVFSIGNYSRNHAMRI